MRLGPCLGAHYDLLRSPIPRGPHHIGNRCHVLLFVAPRHEAETRDGSRVEQVHKALECLVPRHAVKVVMNGSTGLIPDRYAGEDDYR